ncbi:uncharacterized protein LOC134782171 isoform X2 [Penaeus indicus]|uniref:uncharacterized protein LOC134782171 isoform X2 n=1 Tax=Penaeus indicus TaxID=29960 RepID=UPI00300D754C
MREAVSTKQHSDTNTPSTAPIPSTSPSEKPREMSSAVDSASTEAQPKDGRDGGNQGLANTTENRGAEAEEPAKNVPWGRTTAYTEVDGLSERYPMNHRPRGAALIFAHSEFLDKSLNPRPSAAHDAEIARAAFEALGFLPEVFFNFTRNELVGKLHEGFPAFTSNRKGIQGSVFIHYLAENLKNYANTSPRPSLSSILLKVSREVAVLYESDIESQNKYHENKQVPYIHSTLLREIYF